MNAIEALEKSIQQWKIMLEIQKEAGDNILMKKGITSLKQFALTTMGVSLENTSSNCFLCEYSNDMYNRDDSYEDRCKYCPMYGCWPVYDSNDVVDMCISDNSLYRSLDAPPSIKDIEEMIQVFQKRLDVLNAIEALEKSIQQWKIMLEIQTEGFENNNPHNLLGLKEKSIIRMDSGTVINDCYLCRYTINTGINNGVYEHNIRCDDYCPMYNYWPTKEGEFVGVCMDDNSLYTTMEMFPEISELERMINSFEFRLKGLKTKIKKKKKFYYDRFDINVLASALKHAMNEVSKDLRVFDWLVYDADRYRKNKKGD